MMQSLERYVAGIAGEIDVAGPARLQRRSGSPVRGRVA
jgi:hypothetical protein